MGLFLVFSGISASESYELLPAGGGKAVKIPLEHLKTVGDVERLALKARGIRYELLYKENALSSDVAFEDLDPREPIYIWPILSGSLEG